MAKKTNIGTIVEDLMVDLSPEAMEVKTGKGKKATVDAEATLANITTNLSYYRGLFDAFDAVSDKVEGLEDAIAEHKVAYDTLYAYAEENYAEDMEALAEAGIEAFGVLEDEEAEDDAFAFVGELELDDAKAVAKACGIKVMKKDTVESIVEKLEEEVEEEDLVATLTELGYYDEDEEEAEEEEDEDEVDEDEESEEEDETPDYSEMSLGDLRKLCKENGIKYTPKEKADDLIAKLDEFYGAEDEDEEEAEEEDEEQEEETSYEDMSLAELRAECKERGIKYTPKQKSADLIALLEESDAEEEESDEEAEDEEEEEEGADYSEMSLGDLRKLCKENGIKYTPKEKADDLIAKLDEFYGAEDEDEEEAEEEDEEQEEETSYEDMSLAELRAECKERGIKYTPKQKSADLIALLEESDAEEEESDEEAEDEEEEEEGADYSEMSLGELRKECKARGIKYTPKEKSEDLIAKLEEADGADEEEDEESDEEEVDEHELDEILDEEFEDEVLDAEDKATKKGGKAKGKRK